MRDFFKGKAFKIIVCVLALIFGAMIYQAVSGNYASVPEAVVGTVVTPVVELSGKLSDKVAGFFNMLLTARETRQENEQLRRELSDAYGKLGDLEQYRNENLQLKEFLGVKELHEDFEMQPATVIGRDSADRFDSFIINRGNLHGVSLNDPVITSEGLVGLVSFVGPTYSTVTTLLDDGINIGIRNARTEETGVISGTDALSREGKTKLRLLPRDTSLLSGDVIETSGVGGVFPAGLLVGTVESLHAENSGVSMYAKIRPMVEVGRVSDVMVITDFFGKQSAVPDKKDS